MFLYILPNKAFKYMPPLPLSPRHAHGIIKARRLNKQIYTDAKTKTAVVFTSHVVQTKEINYWKEQKSRKLWRTENKEIWIYLGLRLRSKKETGVLISVLRGYDEKTCKRLIC